MGTQVSSNTSNTNNTSNTVVTGNTGNDSKITFEAKMRCNTWVRTQWHPCNKSSRLSVQFEEHNKGRGTLIA